VQITPEWVNDLDYALGWGDKHRSHRLLSAVLETLRDCLPIANTAHLSAQLPLILRGVYFEHWRPAAEHVAFALQEAGCEDCAVPLRSGAVAEPAS
jgi:uncharacterized protein (DUF2267 family)